MVSDSLFKIAQADDMSVYARFNVLRGINLQFMEADSLADLVTLNAEFLVNIGLLKMDHMREPIFPAEPSEILHYVNDYGAMERWVKSVSEYMSARLGEVYEEEHVRPDARLHFLAFAIGVVTDRYLDPDQPPASKSITDYLEAYLSAKG